MKTFIHTLITAYNKRAERIERDGILKHCVNEKGYVLIVVLLVCSLLIVVSGDFLVNTQANIAYLNRFKDEPQAKELAEVGVRVATYVLELDATGKTGSILPGKTQNKSVDSYDDLWATQFPPVPVDDGSFTFTIRDEQAKINASIVANEFIDKTAYFNMMLRFFQNMDLPQDIPYSILDWVDPDNNKSGYGAETADYYSTLPRPYRAKNGPLDSIAELLMIKNITPEIYLGLGGGNIGKEQDIVEDNMNIKPFSIEDLSPDAGKKGADANALPADTRIGPEKSRALYDYFGAFGDKDFTSDLNKININTASFRVISALTPDMTTDKVTEIIRQRMIKPYASVDELSKLIPEAIQRDRLTVSSKIFSIRSVGTYKGKPVTVNAVYNRAIKKFYYYSVR
jgi:type II secretory pathway component PulK